MWLGISLLLTQLLFFNQYELSNAKPMAGAYRRANPGEFIFVISIKKVNNTNREPEKDHGCTGTIVGKKHVLTTAHGVINVPKQNLEVIVGSNDIRSGKKFQIKAMVQYNQWAQLKRITPFYSENDIAIIVLTENIPDNIPPVVLSPLPDMVLYGFEVVIAGWGKIEGGQSPRFLNIGTLKILKKDECKNRVESFTGKSAVFHERFLCSATSPHILMQPGDSGGPLLLLNGELIGINQSTFPVSDVHNEAWKINVHLAIDPYRLFIQSLIRTF